MQKRIWWLVFLFLFIVISIKGFSDNPEGIGQDHYKADKLEHLIQKSKSFLYTSSEQVRSNALKALELASANHDTSYIALSYCYIGASYVMDSNYDTAFVLFYEAEKYALKSEIKYPLVRVYNNIATVYENLNNDEKAFNYYKKAVNIIEEFDLTNMYLPQLSLAYYCCKRRECDSAKRIYKRVINSAKLNNDLYFENLARLNELELFIHEGEIKAETLQENYNAIDKQITNFNIVKLQARQFEVKIWLSIYSGNLEEAMDLINNFPEYNLNDLHKKSNFHKKLIQAYLKKEQFSKANELLEEFEELENDIYNQFEFKINKQNNALWELSTQRLIVEQIKKDKILEEEKNKKLAIYFNVILVLTVILLIAFLVVLYFLLKEEKISESIVYKNGNEKVVINDKFPLHYVNQYPAFIINSNFIYEEANDAFTKITDFTDKLNLKGATDFDLPWKSKSEELIHIYQEIKTNKKIITIEKDLFSCKSHLMYIPLLKGNQLFKILGIVLPNNVVNKVDVSTSKREDVIMKETDIIPKVLLVDDEEDNIILLSRQLRKYQCSLKTASNGKEALELMLNEHFDFVLMDLEMPIKDGFETIKEYVSIEKTRDFKIFALTAHTRNEIKRSEIELFDDIITKPVKKEILISKLSLYLNK